MGEGTPEEADSGRKVRGAILVGIVIVGIAVWRVGAFPANRHAETVRRHLSAAVKSVGYQGLFEAAFNGGAKELDRAAGTPVWTFQGPTVVVKAGASQWWTFWQPRCAIVRIGRDGQLESGVVATSDCFKADLPAVPRPAGRSREPAQTPDAASVEMRSELASRAPLREFRRRAAASMQRRR